jgi:hypothetical protein
MRASHNRLNENTPLTALVQRAHRGRLFQLLVDEGALACAIAFGGGIVLLVLGTEILAWYWLAVLFASGLGLGAYRVKKNFESRYEIACTLDRNLALNDALSTALYFGEHPERTKSRAGVVEQQREMAQEMARSADLRRGLPFAVSRSAYISGLLALIVAGLCALRYGVTGTMDLHRSLVEIAHDSFFDSKTRADAHKKPGGPRAKDWANPASMKYDPWEAQPLDQSGAPDSALSTIDTPNVDNSNNTGPSADPQAKGNPSSQDNPDSSADDPNGSERSSGSNDQSPDGSQGPSKDGGKSGTPPQGADQKQNPGENSSLTDKMKDALSNLLSKFKSQPKGSNGKQSGSQQNQSGTQQNAGNRQSNPNGSPTPGRPQADAIASPDGQGGQDSQGNEQAKSGQGKNNGKSDDRNSPQDGKSGIGRQDGDKSAKEAEQLAAMGKISEIIGKRSQNVSGEVMVEVGSGHQQLKTQYSQKKAAHGDTGGEIGRDEVPLAYQQFVQQYFEELRKTPPAGAKGKKAADGAKKPGAS